MLEINKEIKVKGVSKIGDASAKVFEATINTVNPETMTFNHYVTNYELYKTNRVLINGEQLQFEDAAYLLQDQLISEKAVQ